MTDRKWAVQTAEAQTGVDDSCSKHGDDIIPAPRDENGLPRCPRCGGVVPDELHPDGFQGAISRRDNRTEICSRCGGEEAVLGLVRPPAGVNEANNLRRFRVCLLTGDCYCFDIEAESEEAARASVEADYKDDHQALFERDEWGPEADHWIEVSPIDPDDNAVAAVSSRQTNGDVLLTCEEFDLLMSIAVDWLDDDGPGGPSEFTFIANQLEGIIAAHGTGDNIRGRGPREW